MTFLNEWVARAARTQPDTPALIAAGRTWRYGELAEEAQRGAARLAEAGFGAGDVAAVAGSSPDLAMAAHACAAAGVALLPLDPASAEARWPALQALGGPRLKRWNFAAGQFAAEPLLHPPATARCCRSGSAANPVPAQSLHGGALVTACNASALVIATSGSEGTPKAVMLSRANLDAAAAASNERLPLEPGDLWLDCLPLQHIGGISILYRCARAGAGVLVHEGFDAAAVWRDLAAQRASHISLVPAMLARLLDHSQAPPPAHLRYALVGGAALSRPLFERAVAAGWPVCPTYGMTECAAQMATLVRPAAGTWHEGAVGTPLAGFEAAVGADGRIRLRGPQVMLGYLNPELAPGCGLEEGWFVTSDLGRVDADGRITALGRADDMFVSGGVNVHPLEVESCLAACPGVADVAVSARPDPVWGDLLVALVVGQAMPEAVLAWGRERLPKPQRPRRVLHLERLPRTPLGKLDRLALRVLAESAR